MTYRDEREALRAKVERLEGELEAAKAATLEDDGGRAERRSRLIRGGVVLGALAAVIGGAFYARSIAEAEEKREVTAAWSALSSCLLGGPDPLAGGERPVDRVRAIGLAAPPEAGTEKPWPARCQAVAHEAYLKLKANGAAENGTKDAAYWAEHLAAGWEKGIDDWDLYAAVDGLYGAAALQKLEAIPGADVSDGDRVPKPAKALRVGELPAISGAEVDLSVDPVPSRDKHVLVARARAGTLLCTLTAKDGAFACKELPGALVTRRNLRIRGGAAEGVAPMVLADDGVYRSSTGERVISGAAESAYAGPSGYVAAARQVGGDGQFDLIEQDAPGALLRETTITSAAQGKETTIQRATIASGRVLLSLLDQSEPDPSWWIAVGDLGPGHKLPAALPRVANVTSPIGEPFTLAMANVCRSKHGAILGAHGVDPAFWFQDDEIWRGPVPAATMGAFECDGDAAVLFDGASNFMQRCTADGCERAPRDAWRAIAPTWNDIVTVRMGAALVVAWRTPNHGVRVRVGPPGELGKATEHVVYDDHVGAQGTLQKDTNLSSFALLATPTRAVLLLVTKEGLRAVQISADGSFSPAG